MILFDSTSSTLSFSQRDAASRNQIYLRISDAVDNIKNILEHFKHTGIDIDQVLRLN